MNKIEKNEILDAISRIIKEAISGISISIEELNKKTDSVQKQVEKIPEMQGQITKLQEQMVEQQEETRKLQRQMVEQQEETRKLQRQMIEQQGETRKISRSLAVIEQEHGDKLKALFDAFTTTMEKIEAQEKRTNICERKIEKHNADIYYLKSKVPGL